MMNMRTCYNTHLNSPALLVPRLLVFAYLFVNLLGYAPGCGLFVSAFLLVNYAPGFGLFSKPDPALVLCFYP